MGSAGKTQNRTRQHGREAGGHARWPWGEPMGDSAVVCVDSFPRLGILLGRLRGGDESNT